MPPNDTLPTSTTKGTLSPDFTYSVTPDDTLSLVAMLAHCHLTSPAQGYARAPRIPNVIEERFLQIHVLILFMYRMLTPLKHDICTLCLYIMFDSIFIHISTMTRVFFIVHYIVQLILCERYPYRKFII